VHLRSYWRCKVFHISLCHQSERLLAYQHRMRRDVMWCGVVLCGVVWCGVVWCGVVWCTLHAGSLPPNVYRIGLDRSCEAWLLTWTRTLHRSNKTSLHSASHYAHPTEKAICWISNRFHVWLLFCLDSHYFVLWGWHLFFFDIVEEPHICIKSNCKYVSAFIYKRKN
jgi:hypothetical protein